MPSLKQMRQVSQNPKEVPAIQSLSLLAVQNLKECPQRLKKV